MTGAKILTTETDVNDRRADTFCLHQGGSAWGEVSERETRLLKMGGPQCDEAEIKEANNH